MVQSEIRRALILLFRDHEGANGIITLLNSDREGAVIVRVCVAAGSNAFMLLHYSPGE